MTAFVLATHNAHKVAELRALLGPALGEHEIVGYDGPEPIEDADSFAGNALIKARAAAEFTGLPALADDSGISAVALDGRPGIYSARYAQFAAEAAGLPVPDKSDTDNLRLLLANLQGHDDRRASFWCAAALVDPDAAEGEREHVELAEWPGSVLEAPAGAGGFGYDPVFRPDGVAVSAAELTAEQKNAISHRSRAFAALVVELRRRFG
jgi:XTP/dITP diphosphohydrolase